MYFGMELVMIRLDSWIHAFIYIELQKNLLKNRTLVSVPQTRYHRKLIKSFKSRRLMNSQNEWQT